MQPMLDRIRVHATRSLKLADDFVQLARLATLVPRVDLIDLVGVFEEAIDGLYEISAMQHVALELDAPVDLPPISGDAALLVRAVGNLLDNAVKYSPPGSAVSCRIEFDGKSVICCTVADTGPGIAPERLAALFARFGTNDAGVGLSAGLGLAFVKRAVELQGGAIACKTGASGTTFHLNFPVPSTDPALFLA
jgi:signal transduction histidine kinase